MNKPTLFNKLLFRYLKYTDSYSTFKKYFKCCDIDNMVKLVVNVRWTNFFIALYYSTDQTNEKILLLNGELFNNILKLATIKIVDDFFNKNPDIANKFKLNLIQEGKYKSLEEYRTIFLRNQYISIGSFISHPFSWYKSNEGINFWEQVANNLNSEIIKYLTNYIKYC